MQRFRLNLLGTVVLLALIAGAAFAEDKPQAAAQPPAPEEKPQVLGSASGPGWKVELTAAEPENAKERFERAWWEFCNMQRQVQLTREEQRKLAVKAIGYARQAYKESPREARYAESLAYMYMKDEAYPLAVLYFDEATRLNPKEPRIALLRAMSVAAAVISKPKRTTADIKQAMDAYEKAAGSDKNNPLPYLMAASAAFSLDRPDIGEEMTTKALARKEMRLPFLPIPHSLDPAKADVPCRLDGYKHGSELLTSDAIGSLAMWYIGQHSLLRDLRGAIGNVVGHAISLGREAEKAKKLQQAFDRYRAAGLIGKQVAHSEPLLFFVASDALSYLEASYVAQEQILRAAGFKKEAEDVATEMGVVSMARIFAEERKQDYYTMLATKRPASWEELAKAEVETSSMLRRWAGPPDIEPAGAVKFVSNQPNAPAKPAAKALSPASAKPAVKQSATRPAVNAVYITRTGKRYHRAGCSSLHGKGTLLSRADARAKGLAACQICKPG